VVIEEIMFHPREGSPEFIELHNATRTPFDIAEWKLGGGVEFEFPAFDAANGRDSILRPDERLIVTSVRPSELRQKYNLPNGARVFGPWRGALNNAGDQVWLRDKNGSRMSEVTFAKGKGWPKEADGFGHSLVLVNPNRAVDDVENWRASRTMGGSPGVEEPGPRAATPVALPGLDVAVTNSVIRVGFEDIWRYHNPTALPPINWQHPGFDDQSWSRGIGLFGFETASLPSPGIQTAFNTTGRATYYFRRSFQLETVSESMEHVLDLVVDDGAVVFVNSQEVGRIRMPEGNVNDETLATGTVGDAVLEEGVWRIPAGLLKPGANMIAVAVHQATLNSSDLVFGLRLRELSVSKPKLVINEIDLGRTGGGFIELQNISTERVSAEGYSLTDDLNLPRKLVLGSAGVVEPGGWIASKVDFGAVGAGSSLLYLIAPDGKVESALRLDALGTNTQAARLVDGGSDWIVPGRSTPGQSNVYGFVEQIPLRLNEVRNLAAGLEWVEIYNPNPFRVQVGDHRLVILGDAPVVEPLSGEIEGFGIGLFRVTKTLKSTPLTIGLRDGFGNVVDAVEVDAAEERTRARVPDGGREWFITTNATPSTANVDMRNRRVVINEIMAGLPSGESNGQYVELFNRSDAPVDLSGWRLRGGISAQLAPGTRLEARSYGVVVADTAQIRRVYGELTILGEFSGRLSKRMDHVRVEDAVGNLVNAVDYKSGGDWPEDTAGAGASLELLNPDVDNRLPSAWRGSDESGKSVFRSFSMTGIYPVLKAMGTAADYKELHLYLTGEGHVILDKLRLTRFGSSSNLLFAANQISTTGRGDFGWVCQGTHAGSFVSGGQLHLVADDRGDNRVNKAEIDLIGMNRNDLVTLSFDARWVSGSPRLIAQTWDRSISGSFRLDVPENLGTPGRRNSRFQAHPPPQVDFLGHQPPVPKPGDRIRATAKISSLDALTTVQLFHRVDNVNGNAAWASKPMYDDGQRGGDEVAGDGVYTGELSEHAVAGRLVQFYVRATTVAGEGTSLPREDTLAPAMFVVDEPEKSTDLRRSRFIVSAYDLDAVANGGSEKFGYKYPRLQNHYFNATFISEERDIYYGIRIRNTGSPWTRSRDLTRAKWKLPNDRLFRGRYKYAWDNDAEGRISHNRVTRQLLYWMGEPINEQEFVMIAVNDGPFVMKEETDPIDNDYLDLNCDAGSEGELYRVDDEWWFTDAGQQDYRNADWLYKQTENPGRYRTEYMKRTKEADDDYSALIHFFKVISGNYTQAQAERLIDAGSVLKMAAVRGYVADWDFFSMARGKNAWFYRPPVDGRFRFLHWDSDQAFGDVDRPFQAGVAGYAQWANQPYNIRRFNAYLVELMERYTGDSARMTNWLRAEEEASETYTADAGFYANWFARRRSAALTALGGAYRSGVEISASSIPTSPVIGELFELRGSAPSGTLNLELQDHPEAELEWTTARDWRLSKILLAQGTNTLTVLAYGSGGPVLSRARVVVTRLSNAAPGVRFTPDANDWRAQVSEWVEVDAVGSRDPEGGPLTYQWEVLPSAGVLMRTNEVGRMSFRAFKAGVYDVQVTCADDLGRTNSYRNSIVVHGPGGLSRFDRRKLEDYWVVQGMAVRDNYSPSSWYSLTEPEGVLTMASEDDSAKPMELSGNGFPALWRAAPTGTEWVFQTEVATANRAEAVYEGGLAVDLVENGRPIRWVMSLAGNGEVAVKRMDGATGTTRVISESSLGAKVGLRVRRSGGALGFETTARGRWNRLTTVPVGSGATLSKVGLFLATSEARRVRMSFFHAVLADPQGPSNLQGALSIGELMYGPPGGDTFEFLELVNLGTDALELEGARFTNGISYTFPPMRLASMDRVVLVRDRAAFVARYGEEGRRLAPGVYAGKLDNAGERLTLVDREARVVLDFVYGTGEDWPRRANGLGASLEPIEGTGDPSDAASWRSSVDYLGSPGRPGQPVVMSIVINEIVARASMEQAAGVELYNAAEAEIAVGGWVLSDEVHRPGKYKIPEGTTIPAGGYVSLLQTGFGDTNSPSSFRLRGDQGGELWLFATDSKGEVVRFVDHREYAASALDMSQGRYPDGVGPWRGRLAETTLRREAVSTTLAVESGATNAAAISGPVVISKVMYRPSSGSDEYLQIMNLSDVPVDLFDSTTTTNGWRIRRGIRYEFPQGSRLDANEVGYVVSADPEMFRARKRLAKSVPIFGPYDGSLSSEGESLELERPGVLARGEAGLMVLPYYSVDEVAFSGRYPWPAEANGGGMLLHRLSLNTPATEFKDWEAQVEGFDSDSDLDGLPDDYEIGMGLDPNDAVDAGLDPDHDGFSTLQEYLTGTDPFVSADRFSIESIRVTGNSVALKFVGGPAKAYRVLRSDQIVNGQWTMVAEVKSPVGGGWVEVTGIALAGEAGASFYRVVTP